MKLNPKFLTHVTKGEHYMISTSDTKFKGRFEGRRPKLNGKKCVGCHLCLLVCPADAISP